MSEIINCLTYVINNWDKLENGERLYYRNEIKGLRIPIMPYLGLCNFLAFFKDDYDKEIQNAIHEWAILYSRNYDDNKFSKNLFWIAGDYEYNNHYKFKNPLRLHAVIWIRNKLLSEKYATSHS